MAISLCRTMVAALAVWAAVAPAAPLRADPSDDQFAVAAGHYDQKRWKLAVEEFQAFLQKFPDDRRVNQCAFFLGEALLQSGKFDDAREQIRKYLAREPSGKYAQVALFRAGEAAYLAGQFSAAKPDLEAFLAKYPDDRLNAYVLPYLGEVALANGDAAAAVDRFRLSLARFPDGRLQDDCQLGLARALAKQGQLEEAQRLYLAIANKPGSPLADAAEFHLGSLHYAAGRYQQAIEAFSTLEARPTASDWRPNAQLGRGLSLLKLDRPSEAVKQFDAVLATPSAGQALFEQATHGKAQAALQTKDDDRQGKLELAWSQYKAGKLTEAAESFDAVLQKNPSAAVAAEAALVRGRILEQLGQIEPALAMYDLVADKHSASVQHVDALLSAARLRDKLKQGQQAAALYQRLVDEHPQFPKLDAVLYEWAWVADGLDQPVDSARLFERVHKEFPQSRFWADATYRLAQRAMDAREYDRAAALADEVLAAKTDPKVREYALFVRGQIGVAKTNWPKAREAFLALAKEFADSPQRLAAEFWVAEAYYRQGDYAAAGPRLLQLAEAIKDKHETWMAIVPLRRAQMLAQQKQWSDAQAIAASIAADFPGFGQQYEVDYLLGRCLANQADFTAAREAYDKVINSPNGIKTETAAMAQWMIGETFFHQKNYEAARQAYLKVDLLYAYPIWQAGALLQAGKCHEQLGQPSDAVELYQGILKKYPDTTFAQEAAVRLKGLEKAASPK